jgi:hypothetical protein
MNNPGIERVLEKEINPIEELRNKVDLIYRNIEGQYYQYIEGNVSENIRNTARSVNEFMNSALKGIELPIGNKVMIALTTLAIISALTAGSAMALEETPTGWIHTCNGQTAEITFQYVPQGDWVTAEGWRRDVERAFHCGTEEQADPQATEVPATQGGTRDIQGGQPISGNANVRMQPTINSDSLGTLSSFSGVVTGNVETTVIDANGETWTQVVLADGRVGWVSDRLTSYPNGDNDSVGANMPNCNPTNVINVTFTERYHNDRQAVSHGYDGRATSYSQIGVEIGGSDGAVHFSLDGTNFDGCADGDYAPILYSNTGDTIIFNGVSCTIMATTVTDGPGELLVLTPIVHHLPDADAVIGTSTRYEAGGIPPKKFAILDCD